MATPYKRILVPLDGSKLAEVAVGDAVTVAESMRAELTLLRVIPPITDLLQTDGHPLHIDEQFELRRAQGFEYLDQVRHRIGGRDATIHIAVAMGPPADAILEFARTHAMDLIVMATHGRSGITRWVLGSVADKVLRSADGPVLLVRAREAIGG